MKLQELVNDLSNKLAIVSGDTPVHIKAAENQEIADNITVEDTDEGKIIVIQNG